MIRFLHATLASAVYAAVLYLSLLLVPPCAAAGHVQAAHPPVTAASLQMLLDHADYINFARQLPEATGLRPEQELYFRGTLAYRQGRFQEVIDPLVTAIRTKHTSLTRLQVERAFEILGETATKTFRYSSSATMYSDIDRLYGAQLGAAGRREIRDREHIATLLQNVPEQTVQLAADFTIPRSGAAEYPVFIGGQPFAAQLDTGASVSLLSESTARSWGVTLLNGTATLHGYGGGAFTARPGLISELQIGSATLRNVVVFVTADSNLYIADIQRQTHALLGFSVASALGRLTFARDGSLTVTAQTPPSQSTTGAHMWVGDGSLLVALGTQPVTALESHASNISGGTEERLFELDTGSGSTYLTDHYLTENRARFTGEPEALARLAGAGGIHEIPAYEARKLPLYFGATPVLCTGQHVLTQPQGGEAESYYGVIGQDILRLFASYTLDFRTMRLSVTP